MKRNRFKLIASVLLAGCLTFAHPIAGMAEEPTPEAGEAENTTAEPATPWDGSSTASAFKSGDGSFGAPYVISTPEEFNYFAMFISRNGVSNKKYFVLENDLDFGGHTISSVGSKDAKFSGTFDGRGHTISNLCITSNVADGYVGLFGNINGSNAHVKNFTLKNVTVSGDRKQYTGAVAGFLTKGTISNVILESTVTVQVKGVTTDESTNGVANGSTGGVVGRCYGTIQYVVSEATVIQENAKATSPAFVGGITGVTGNGTGVITDCIVRGTVTADSGVVGGISGIVGAGNGGGRVENCIADVAVTSQQTAGGVLGKIHTDSGHFLVDCINLSDSVTAPVEKQGTIIGDIAKTGTVTGCSTVAVDGIAKYGSGASSSVDLSAFEMTEISAENAEAAVTALQAKIDENAAKEAEIVYADEDDGAGENDPPASGNEGSGDNGTGDGEGNGDSSGNDGMGGKPAGVGNTNNTDQNKSETESVTSPVAAEESGCSSTVSLAGGLMLVSVLGLGVTLLKKEKRGSK